jgi:hypothetical protein
MEAAHMKLGKDDLRTLRKSLWGFTATLLVSGIVIYITEDIELHTKQQLRNAQNSVQAARGQLETARQDAESMDAYSIEYGALLDQKIIGEDRRLDWIEGLEAIRKQGLLNDFRYSIDPQQPYTAQPPIDSGNFDVRTSTMKLQLDLLHEGQLVDFFSALRHNSNGWYQLESCSLQRKNATATQALTIDTTAHLGAECSGSWVTLKNRNEQP